jgi:hypothetical protein
MGERVRELGEYDSETVAESLAAIRIRLREGRLALSGIRIVTSKEVDRRYQDGQDRLEQSAAAVSEAPIQIA